MSSSEGLYRTTVCRCLVHRPHYPSRLMRFESRGPSEFFFQICHRRNALTKIDRDCVGRRRTGTRLGNVYRSVREKQGIVTGSYCLSATCFTNSDLSGHCFTCIWRARPPEKKKPDFWYGKNKFPERTAEMESRSRSKLKGAWPNVRKESK